MDAHEVELRVALRKRHLQLEEEAVELRFRQRIGSLLLDRILRRDDHESRGELVRGAVDRDRAFLHRLEQRGLRLRRRAVDLVREQELREDRSALQVELARLEVEEVRADDVAGHEIGRELDALERELEARREALREQRLADAGRPFEKHVSFADERDQETVQVLVLPHHDSADSLSQDGGHLPHGLDVDSRIRAHFDVISIRQRWIVLARRMARSGETTDLEICAFTCTSRRSIFFASAIVCRRVISSISFKSTLIWKCAATVLSESRK
jgi:hypothetical protein